MAALMIYGCTSYTARLALEDAASLDLSIILGGRSENKIKTLASGLNLPYRIFELDDAGLVDASLKDVKVLLNCSGPCKHTAQPLMTACIRTGTHYIDIAAELDSYERALQLDREARDARVLLMPGCGGSVAMLGCLANYALERVENPKSIDIALHVAGSISRGSAVSASEGISNHYLKRAEGVLVEEGQGATLDFELPRRQRSCGVFPMTLPDLITIWKSTSVPNIQTFVHVSAEEHTFPTGSSQHMPVGPTERQRKASPYHAAVVVAGEDGSVREAVLHTANGYTFTAKASLEAARRILQGVKRTGFQTPADVFGMRFVGCVAGSVTR
ncbi:LOW QUALITY PROTEIN: hypothetical protein NLU13_8147 [Sarocladium strictum]|uniref:Saccharopine dehydrogenase NADP binding domain-containing protein n=1 Tax=Sarocladium strictum TaxID=5046 RepID=A0AA39GC88_SARSR|nr:LOW QUALITY PROTEIN: hypothetical protein NLU13_8147 [Sarocladium strictum]